MRYGAFCPTCNVRTTITLETLTPASPPVYDACGAALRLSTETMQSTPLAEVWLVPQEPDDGSPPAIEHVSEGLAPERQAAFEALMRQACQDEAGLIGYEEL